MLCPKLVFPTSSRPDHDVLVLDVGAYTSDFAALEFDLTDVDIPPRITASSEPLGVSNLDREVESVLNHEKAQTEVDPIL